MEDEAVNDIVNNTSKDNIVELGQKDYEIEMLLDDVDALTEDTFDVSEKCLERENLFNEDILKEELLDAEETESMKHLYSNEDENIVEAVEKKDQYFRFGLCSSLS